MTKTNTKSQMQKNLIRRYLLWFYKSTKESFERIERKTTQLMVDEYVLKNLKTTDKEFEAYVKDKQKDELKLKYSDAKKKNLNPEHVQLKDRLQAIEAAIKHFLGEKELCKMQELYEKEFTTRILQARDH